MSLHNKTVLCFIASLSAGGAERQMVELMRVLHGQGLNVELLTYAGEDQYECPSYVKRHYINHSVKAFLPFLLIRKICSIRFDCCISFLTKNNMIACLVKCFVPQRRLIVGERNFTSELTRMKKMAYKLYRKADYVVPNSESEAAFIRSHASWLSAKIVTIQNYTDIEKNHPRTKVSNGKIDVGVFARYSKQKNPMYLVKVAKSLKDRGYNEFCFHWYGNKRLNMLGDRNGLSDEYVELEDYINEHNLLDSFFLNGFVNNTAEVMANMDVICLSSLHEGYPNAISEGMSCGKAIVASRVSDVPYLVEDGKNGFLFDPTDLESGIKAFIRYYDLSVNERIKMSERNRAKAVQLFSKEEFTNKYMSLIND